MTAAQSTTEQQVRFVGIKPLTEAGNAAKLDQGDEPIQVVTNTGDAVGSIENISEYTDAKGHVGDQFDVVIKPGTSGAGASGLTLKADADSGAGSIREITEDINYTCVDAQAASFSMGTPVTEPLA